MIVYDVEKITLLKNDLLSPSKYLIFGNCPATSITVERSFSMLKKAL